MKLIYVLLERSLVFEHLGASIEHALKLLPLLSLLVLEKVILEVASAGKALVAQAATEWFLACVRSEMTIEIIFLGKGRSTVSMLALKWLYLFMDNLMLLQYGQLLEGLTADLAPEWA